MTDTLQWIVENREWWVNQAIFEGSETVKSVREKLKESIRTSIRSNGTLRNQLEHAQNLTVGRHAMISMRLRIGDFIFGDGNHRPDVYIHPDPTFTPYETLTPLLTSQAVSWSYGESSSIIDTGVCPPTAMVSSHRAVHVANVTLDKVIERTSVTTLDEAFISLPYGYSGDVESAPLEVVSTAQFIVDYYTKWIATSSYSKNIPKELEEVYASPLREVTSIARPRGGLTAGNGDVVLLHMGMLSKSPDFWLGETRGKRTNVTWKQLEP